jgi:glucokinase
MTLAIGVDLGATKTAIVLVDSEGNIRTSHLMLTKPEQGPESVLARIAQVINSFHTQAPSEVAGVGVGVAGINDPQDGRLIYGKNLDWRQVKLVEGLQRYLDVPLDVFLQTDTNAEALGEFYFGAARGCSNFVYLSLGSGLGGAVIANGQLITGAKNMGGVVGLLSLDPNGRPDNSGIRGCTETVISARGLITHAKEIHARREYATTLEISPGLSTEDILEAAKEDDPLALAALAEMGKYLGEVMAYCVAILNPALIVIAGGLGLAALQWIVPAAREEMERRTYIDAHADLQIVPSILTSSGIGAACLVYDTMGIKPIHDA